MYIASGFAHTVLVSDDGRIWTFGYNNYGQLGHGDDIDRIVPTEIQRRENGIPEDVTIIGVSCGAHYTVLLSDDNRIWTFGSNWAGQLGLGDTEHRNVPTLIQGKFPKDVKIVKAICGGSHTVLLADDGKHIWTFGVNASSQLGISATWPELGRTKNKKYPAEIYKANYGKHRNSYIPNDVKIVNVSCGPSRTVLQSDDGTIWILGDKYNYGPRELIVKIRGTEIPENVKIICISCGSEHTVLLSDDGRIWTFGSNEHGQLGHEYDEDTIIPTEIQREKLGLPEGVKIVSVSCGEKYTVLLSDDGRIWTFGLINYIYIPPERETERPELLIRDILSIPTELQIGENKIPENVKIVGVGCGYHHMALLSDDGRIWTFGYNEYGQLGLGDDKNRNVPSYIQDFSLRHFGSLTKSANKA